MADPMIRNVLNNFQEDPQQAQKDMQDPSVAAKLRNCAPVENPPMAQNSSTRSSRSPENSDDAAATSRARPKTASNTLLSGRVLRRLLCCLPSTPF